jgi:hypothetical protein
VEELHEGEASLLRFASVVPSPACRHPLPEGEGFTKPGLRTKLRSHLLVRLAGCHQPEDCDFAFGKRFVDHVHRDLVGDVAMQYRSS